MEILREYNHSSDKPHLAQGQQMTQWQCVLELNSKRETVSGHPSRLLMAIGNAADLRISTEFRHNEHIDVSSPSPEKIREVAEFAVTYHIDRAWAAGIMSLRQPIDLPTGFGARPSMSFFLYNQDGTQAIARPFLDGVPPMADPGPSSSESPEAMPKYHILNSWDAGTISPSHNFVYDFDVFRYCVSDTWQEVLHHSGTGEVLSGTLDQLVDAFSSGCAIKLGIENLCTNLTETSSASPHHEVFVQGGSAYYYTEQKLFMIGTHPVVRVSPRIPMEYISAGWDFGWLMARTDGRVVFRRCDPYSLQFSDHVTHHAIRWFVR